MFVSPFSGSPKRVLFGLCLAFGLASPVHGHAQDNPEAVVAAVPPAAAAPPLASFTPQDSPLLAHFDNKPHGQEPKREPEFERPRRRSGWQVSSYPYGWYGLGYDGGCAPYWGGYYRAPYYGYYGYPRLRLGFGLGFGLGVGFGRPYYGGYYGGGWGGGGHFHQAGGRAFVSSGMGGRR